VTVVLVEHDMELVMDICERIVVAEPGRGNWLRGLPARYRTTLK